MSVGASPRPNGLERPSTPLSGAEAWRTKASAVFGSIKTRGWPMRPWMGALAATAAIAVLPTASALAADGDPSVIEFKLPSKAAAQQLIDQGFDLADGLDQSQPRSVE